jgi:hypothetical protein
MTGTLRQRGGSFAFKSPDAGAPPLAVTDEVLFRWARIVRIGKLFPVMHAIRALESKLQRICRSCTAPRNAEPIDRSILDVTRRELAECSDEKARLVKEAAGIVRYHVRYHDLAGTVREVVR